MTLIEPVPTYELCRFCLMCRHVCPVGRVTKLESNTPHGWALLIASVDRGQMEWNAEAVNRLYECAECGLCHTNCVTDQPLPGAIAAARARVVALGAAPQSVTELNARLSQWGNPYIEETAPKIGETAANAVFVGAGHHLRPQAAEAASKLLTALGLAHVRVGQGISSATLPFALGLHDTAKALAQTALQQIAASQCERLITLSAEDAYAFNVVLPQLDLSLPDGIVVVDVMTLLAEAVDNGQLKLNPVDLSYTYHDAAHSADLPARAGAARKVLTAVTNKPVTEMFWRAGRAAPGGAVGGLNLTNPDLAARMTRERLAEAAATGAEILITDDPAALADFEKYATSADLKIESFYELLARQLA